jgi:hypothetical protein
VLFEVVYILRRKLIENSLFFPLLTGQRRPSHINKVFQWRFPRLISAVTEQEYEIF